MNEINKKIRVDRSIIRFLTVKLKKLDLEKEFLKKIKAKILSGHEKKQ